MKAHIAILLGASFAAASILSPVTLSAQMAPPVATIIAEAPAEIPFELYRGNRIILQGKLNGHSTPMLLDNGASSTTLDAAFARTIGLEGGQKINVQGVGGSQEAQVFGGVTIDVGNLRLSDATVGAIDLSLIEKAVGRPIPVILGRELFMNNVVAIDFDRQVIRLSPSTNFKPPVGAREVKLTRGGPIHFLPISIMGLPPVEAALDLGNAGALAVSKDYLDTAPAIRSLPFATGMIGGVGGRREIRRATLPNVEIAGFSLDNVPASLGTPAVGPTAKPANAGIQIFKHFEVTLDLGNDRMWLKRTGEPVRFDRDRAGIFLSLEGEYLEVAHVSSGSPAQQAGIRQGDRITAISGQRVDEKFYSSAASNWASGPSGTAVELTRADGSKVTLTLRDYF
jgi:hypothetical protein